MIKEIIVEQDACRREARWDFEISRLQSEVGEGGDEGGGEKKGSDRESARYAAILYRDIKSSVWFYRSLVLFHTFLNAGSQQA